MPCRNAATMGAYSLGELLLRNPITGIDDCCARATSGHAAAPPTSVMNSRRFTAQCLQCRSAYDRGIAQRRVLHCGISNRLWTGLGQNENTPLPVACQLPP